MSVLWKQDDLYSIAWLLCFILQAVPSVPINCVQLSEEVQMSWVVDDISNVISIELCGCVQVSLSSWYIAS